MPEFQDGEGDSLKVDGFNKYGQECLGHRGVPGNHHNQTAYKMKCGRIVKGVRCNHVYGANGCDVWLRKSPRCQGGRPGIAY